MSERPVAQIVLYGDRSPAARSVMATRLASIGANAVHVAPCWVIATLPMPGCEPDPAEWTRQGLSFVEGRDRAEAAFGSRLLEETRRITKSTNTMRQLPGDITLVRIDEDTATLIRSCAGLSHWFVHHRHNAVMATTRLRFFEDLFDDEFEMDELVLAASTQDSILPWNRTPLAGVSVIPPAHCARISIDRPLHFERYWDPSEFVPHDSGDRPKAFRELFTAALDRDLSKDAPNIITFSGGVDSSIVASLSVGLGRTVETVSLIPTLSYEDPLPSRRTVDTFLKEVPVAANWAIEIDEHRWVDVQMSALRTRVPMLNTTLIAAQHRGLASGARVMTGGEYADELFGGWNTLYDAWVPDLSPVELTRVLLTASSLDRYRAARRWAARRIGRGIRLPCPVQLADFIRPDLRDEYAQYVAELRSELRTIDSPRAFVLAQLSHYTGWLLQNWEGCSEAGMVRSLPFYNREAIEFALSCYPTELAWPPKKLLQASFDGLVPSSHLHRLDKDSAGSSPLARVPIQLDRHMAETVQSIVDPTKLVVTEGLDPDIAARLAPIIVASQRPETERADASSPHFARTGRG